MKGSHNVIPISDYIVKKQVEGIKLLQKKQEAGLAPISRVLKSVYSAIDAIVEERTNLYGLGDNTIDQGERQRIEQLLQRVRVDASDLLFMEMTNVLVFADATAKKHGIAVYCDPKRGDSILIESIGRQNQSGGNHLRKVVG